MGLGMPGLMEGVVGGVDWVGGKDGQKRALTSPPGCSGPGVGTLAASEAIVPSEALVPDLYLLDGGVTGPMTQLLLLDDALLPELSQVSNPVVA